MSSLTVRIARADHAALVELSRATGKSMSATLSDAIQQQKRKHILESMNAEYAELRKDPKAWKELLAERALWDTTLSDGLT